MHELAIMEQKQIFKYLLVISIELIIIIFNDKIEMFFFFKGKANHKILHFLLSKHSFLLEDLWFLR